MAADGRGERLASEWLASKELVCIADRVARAYGFDREDAAEVLQETRIALWMKHPDGPVCMAWVERVAMNKAVDRVRVILRARSADQAFAALEHPNQSSAELKHLLHARLAALPERLRTFYELHYLAGWSERDIATRLGVGRKGIRWLDRCCRRALFGRETGA